MGCSSSAHHTEAESTQEITVSAGLGSAPGGSQNETAARSIPERSTTVNDFISKAQSQRRNGLKPSGPEFIAYAKYLGIDTVDDHDLLWIAGEALEAPLPVDWSEHRDSHDRPFYYNSSTQVSAWTHPLEDLHREAYKTIVDFRSSNLSLEEKVDKLQLLRQDVEELEASVPEEISQWSEHTDKDGNRFYFNREKWCSSWTDPRPAFSHSLNLKMKIFRLLKSGCGLSLDDIVTHTEDNDLARIAPSPGSESDDAAATGSCVICLSASATHVIVPCGHQAFCEACSKKFTGSKRSNCPCCRTRITQIIKVYVPAPREIIPKRPEAKPEKSKNALETENPKVVHL